MKVNVEVKLMNNRYQRASLLKTPNKQRPNEHRTKCTGAGFLYLYFPVMSSNKYDPLCRTTDRHHHLDTVC